MPLSDDLILLRSVTLENKWALCSHFSTTPVLYYVFQAWDICHWKMTAMVEKKNPQRGAFTAFHHLPFIAFLNTALFGLYCCLSKSSPAIHVLLLTSLWQLSSSLFDTPLTAWLCLALPVKGFFCASFSILKVNAAECVKESNGCRSAELFEEQHQTQRSIFQPLASQ